MPDRWDYAKQFLLRLKAKDSEIEIKMVKGVVSDSLKLDDLMDAGTVIEMCINSGRLSRLDSR